MVGYGECYRCYIVNCQAESLSLCIPRQHGDRGFTSDGLNASESELIVNLRSTDLALYI